MKIQKTKTLLCKGSALASLLLLAALLFGPLPVPASASDFLGGLDTDTTAPAPDEPVGLGAGNAADAREATQGTVDVNSGYTLNVRTGPWGKIVGKLKDGAKVDIVGKQGDWYKIEFGGKTAFVHSDYIKKGKKKAPASSGGSSSSGGGQASGNNGSSGGSAGSNAKYAEGAPGSKQAMKWATGGAKTYRNPNNGKTGATAWTGYCLAHVNRCWSVGAGKPVADLQKCCAKQSYYAFKNHGKIKSVPKKGPIPAGAPVFWSGLSKWGHVTISTGRVDKNGVPTVIDNHGGLYEVPITKYGTPSGWGVIAGTPLT